MNEIPPGSHFAMIEKTSLYILGDQRSYANPGHGFPASSTEILTYRAFKTYDELSKAMEGAAIQKRNVKGICVTDTYTVKSRVEAERDA